MSLINGLGAAQCIRDLNGLPDGVGIEIIRPMKGKHKGLWLVEFRTASGTLIDDSMGMTIDEDEFDDTTYDTVYGDGDNLLEAILETLEQWEERKADET